MKYKNIKTKKKFKSIELILKIAKAGRPARTYIQQLYADTGCSPEDLPEAMDDRRGGEREG